MSCFPNLKYVCVSMLCYPVSRRASREQTCSCPATWAGPAPSWAAQTKCLGPVHLHHPASLLGLSWGCPWPGGMLAGLKGGHGAGCLGGYAPHVCGLRLPWTCPGPAHRGGDLESFQSSSGGGDWASDSPTCPTTFQQV